ncbi:hypothetical protein QFX18_15195 [Saccharophagus degradans]|uniref:hypothetical protein n=1 Tax=Saccharophagus degradans TaxID=86304 RepID=UPI002477F3D9|nr:hypothetical protein [Saccharophagus degradans]WGO97381.1 hypothetical protein QFX18_15195 [Saccharophagus degradans]
MSSEVFPTEAIEAKKSKFIESAKQSLLEKIRPIIEYHVRSVVSPETISTEQELNQYYVDEAVNEHQASGKPKHPFKSFAQFSKEQRGE